MELEAKDPSPLTEEEQTKMPNKPKMGQNIDKPQHTKSEVQHEINLFELEQAPKEE